MNLVGEAIQNTADHCYQTIEVKTGEEADILIVDSRNSFINTLIQDTLIQQS